MKKKILIMPRAGKLKLIHKIVTKQPGIRISQIYKESPFGATNTYAFLEELKDENKIFSVNRPGEYYDYSKRPKIMTETMNVNRADKDWTSRQSGYQPKY